MGRRHVLVDFKNSDVCSVLFYALPPCCPQISSKSTMFTDAVWMRFGVIFGVETNQGKETRL